MGEEREYGSLEKRKISVCDWDDLERAGSDQAAQIWISILKAMWSYWGIQNEDGWIRFTFKKNTCSREESVKIRTEKLDLTTKFCDPGQNRSRWRDGMTNFGNWKGSRAGKIKLHLVRPLHILKSPGKPTKNILGLKNNKRHVCMHIHIQSVHQLIPLLFQDSTLTLTQREDLWLQFFHHSLHQMLSFFHH